MKRILAALLLAALPLLGQDKISLENRVSPAPGGTQYAIPYATSTTAIGWLAHATGLQCMTQNGAAAPTWGACGGSFTSPLTTKGDLHAYSTTDARLPIGANGTLLMADSTAATGLSYALPSGQLVTLKETVFAGITPASYSNASTTTIDGSGYTCTVPGNGAVDMVATGLRLRRGTTSGTTSALMTIVPGATGDYASIIGAHSGPWAFWVRLASYDFANTSSSQHSMAAGELSVGVYPRDAATWGVSLRRSRDLQGAPNTATGGIAPSYWHTTEPASTTYPGVSTADVWMVYFHDAMHADLYYGTYSSGWPTIESMSRIGSVTMPASATWIDSTPTPSQISIGFQLYSGGGANTGTFEAIFDRWRITTWEFTGEIPTGIVSTAQGGLGANESAATGFPKFTAGSVAIAALVSGDIPNNAANTSGSAALLTTPRAINGVNFDGSAPITVTADANTLSGTTLKSTVVNSSLTSVGALTALGVGTATPFGKVDVNGLSLILRGGGGGSLASPSGGLLRMYYDEANGFGSIWAYDYTAGVGKALVLQENGGNLGLNTRVFGTSAATVLGIGNGTAPSTSPANMVQLWAEDVSASSELRVRDEAGNVTTLSPHNFSMFTPDPSQIFPWSYYSKNAHIGKEMSVDMYGAIAAIEKLSGKKFIYVADLPADQIEDWTAQEAAKKITVEKQRLDKATAIEVEVAAKDAVEVVAITKERPSATLAVSVTRYHLNPATGVVDAVVSTTPKTEMFDTGAKEARLKAGVRLDEKTGRFWRKTRADEAVVEPYVPKAPPAWMKDRMAKKTK